MSGIVRIRPVWLLAVGLYRAGGCEPPLQSGRNVVLSSPNLVTRCGIVPRGRLVAAPTVAGTLSVPAKSQFTGGTNDRTGPAVLFQMCVK